MKIIILAAGEGKRLRPLTKNIPKCLVDLHGKSILQRQLDVFKKSDINDIVIVKGFQAKSINFPNIKYYENSDFSNTNMLHTLFCAKSEFIDDVIISYGDIIFKNSVLEKLLSSKDDISVIIDLNWYELWKLRFEDPLSDADSLQIDDDGYIVNIGQKVTQLSEIQGQYIGLMKFSKKGISMASEYYENLLSISKTGKNPLNNKTQFNQSYMTDFLQGLISNGQKIKSIPICGDWLEIDSISDYELYTSKKNKSKIDKLFDFSKDQ